MWHYTMHRIHAPGDIASLQMQLHLYLPMCLFPSATQPYPKWADKVYKEVLDARGEFAEKEKTEVDEDNRVEEKEEEDESTGGERSKSESSECE